MPVLISLFATLTSGLLLWAILYGKVQRDARRRRRLFEVTQLHGLSKHSKDVSQQNVQSVEQALRELEAMRSAKGRLTLRMRLRFAGHSGDLRSHYIRWGVTALITSILIGFLSVGIIVQFLTFILMISVVPRVFLNYQTNRRMKQIHRDLPNALDIVVRGLRSGLSLNDCLKLAASELKDPLRGEFARLLNDLSIGLSMEEAVHRFANRIPSQEVNFLAIVVSLQARTGGNLTEGLGNLAKILRDRELLHGKIRAMSSEGRTSAWIIGIIPPAVGGMNILLAPSTIAPLIETPLGNIIVLSSVIWMAIGVFVMTAMINIEV